MARQQHTHLGHCQVCGRPHAADIATSVLANHGYTVEHGFFSGTCAGSGQLPFELECSMVKQSIIWAQTMRDAAQSRAAGLRARTNDVGFVEHYVPAGYECGRRVSGHYETLVAKFSSTTIAYESGSYERITATAMRAADKIEFDGIKHHFHGKTALEAAAYSREQEAKKSDARAEQISRYMISQQARVDSWKLSPLVPIASEAKPKVEAGAVVRMFGKTGFDARVIEIRNERCRGVGPGLNGKVVPHAVLQRMNPPPGETRGNFSHPVQLIHNVVKGA